jgi:hypothetical protein
MKFIMPLSLRPEGAENIPLGFQVSDHNKLRCFYLLTKIVKNFSVKTDCTPSLIRIILRPEAGERALLLGQK